MGNPIGQQSAAAAHALVQWPAVIPLLDVLVIPLDVLVIPLDVLVIPLDVDVDVLVDEPPPLPLDDVPDAPDPPVPPPSHAAPAIAAQPKAISAVKPILVMDPSR